MSDHLNVLLFGAGPIAVAYARVLRELGVAFTAVGRGPASAKAFAEATGQSAQIGGLENYLAGAPVRAGGAIVALPVLELAGATKCLIEHGFTRILAEKPAGLTGQEIAEVAAVARRAGADVFVAYNRRFYASVAAARAMIAEDGGVTSFHFEFTEIAAQVATSGKDAEVLANWFLANSSHVVDLAFHLGGEPAEMNGAVAGALPWHPAGAVFAGHGRTDAGALFTWHADWSSAGRWGLDLRTPRRRLLLQPLETLQVQDKGSMALADVTIDDDLDKRHKPGFYRQLQAFLSSNPSATSLRPLSEHLRTVDQFLVPMLSPSHEEIQHVRRHRG